MNPGMIVGVAFLVMVGAPTIAAGQQVVFLMRHAETLRVVSQADPDPPLAEAGHRRAGILAAHLKEAGISAIYVTDAQRTRRTAEPMAKALGLELRVVGRQEIESLVARVRAEQPQGRVLIVNQALNVPGLLKAFGHPEGIRVALDDFEPFFVIVPRPEGPPLVASFGYDSTLSRIAVLRERFSVGVRASNISMNPPAASRSSAAAGYRERSPHLRRGRRHRKG